MLKGDFRFFDGYLEFNRSNSTFLTSIPLQVYASPSRKQNSRLYERSQESLHFENGNDAIWFSLYYKTVAFIHAPWPPHILYRSKTFGRFTAA